MGIFGIGKTGIGRPGAILVLILTIYTLGCGGGTGSEDNTVSGTDTETVTADGIVFRHNGYYTDEELAEAVGVVDEYYGAVVDCALSVHPELTDAIMSLPASELTVNVMDPDKYNATTGREGFSCNFSEKGCAGTFHLESLRIDITPSLDALGHEMGHWMNFMLFGETHDDDPNDLSDVCDIPSICHLYSKSRNLIACRE